MKKKLLFTVEKNIQNKTYVSWGSKHTVVCLETVSAKHDENDLHRKYRLFGGTAENVSSPTIFHG